MSTNVYEVGKMDTDTKRFYVAVDVPMVCPLCKETVNLMEHYLSYPTMGEAIPLNDHYCYHCEKEFDAGSIILNLSVTHTPPHPVLGLGA